MTDAPTLKPCPFCGDPMEWWGDDMIRHREAGKCPIGMMGFTTQHIAAWNRRALPADDAEMVEKVARALFAAEFYERRGGPVFVSPTDERWKAWLPLARAALSAMRGEP